MSDKILKALMQLFAIIGKYESELGASRRKMEEQFLKQSVNADQAAEYLRVYDEFIQSYNNQENDSEKKRKRTSVRSVKVLLICDQINEALNQKQKIVVLAKLIEYTYVSEKVDEQEREFIDTVYEAFRISEEEFNLIFNFITSPEPADDENLLIIGENPIPGLTRSRYLKCEHLQGTLRVIHVKSADVFFLKYYGVMELTLNGNTISDYSIHQLINGSTIRGSKIHPVYHSDILSCFLNDRYINPIHYKVNEIEFYFPDGKKGLHTLSLAENSGKLIGIMGGSGAGKSTLLNILNGSSPPGTGSVTINGIDLHQDAGKLEGVIGFISQDDLLIEDLTVYQNLHFNAELCLHNLSPEALHEKVELTLKDLGLFEVRNLKVGSPLDKMISGGQRKRLNIALELVREPSVLLVDEPTSGLSSRDSEVIIDLLKTLALKGKVVFVVIHQPSSDIFKVFDKLLILDKGGYPVYLGNPVAAVTHFKKAVNYINAYESQCLLCGNVNPEQIFNIIETRVLDENGQPTRERKITPKEWNSLYKDTCLKGADGSVPYNGTPDKSLYKPGFAGQFRVFIKRDVLSRINNTSYLMINAVEAPLLAFILAFLTRYQKSGSSYSFYDNKNLVAYIFMSVIVALFLGLTVSAEEIFRDRKIRKREAYLNLSKGAYLLSKLVILLFVSAVQTFLFTAIGNYIMGFREMFADYWLILFSVSVFANVLGLNISSAFKSAVSIYIIIPFLIIPQLLLSGLLVKFDELHPAMAAKSVVPVPGEIMATRWAFEAIVVNQFLNNSYEKNIYPMEKARIQSAYRKGIWNNKMQELLATYEKTGAEESKQVLINELKKAGYPNGKTFAVNEVKTFLSGLKEKETTLHLKATQQLDSYFDRWTTDTLSQLSADWLKRNYHNERMAELVTNSGSLGEGICIESGQLHPVENNIYHNPSPDRLLRAPFYAPVKMGKFGWIPTYRVNLFVIVGMTVLLYIALYFEWLRKFMDTTGALYERFKRRKNNS